MKTTLWILMISISLAGCSMPATTVKTVDSRPSISIAGAPTGATLMVDGRQIGNAVDYNGEPHVLLLEPGTHRVVVTQSGSVIYDQQIFVDSESKRIVVR